MPEVTRHELHSGESACLPPVARRAVLPPEADGAIVHADQATIADGRAGDVGAEILQGRTTIAGGLNVHAPVLAPDRGIDLPVMNLEESSQVFPERRLEERQVDQIVGFRHAHEASVPVESGTRDQAMEVGVKSQLLVPGVEHRREAAGGRPKSLGACQLLGQSARDGGEEQIVGLFGEGPEEAGPQLRREREGNLTFDTGAMSGAVDAKIPGKARSGVPRSSLQMRNPELAVRA